MKLNKIYRKWVPILIIILLLSAIFAAILTVNGSDVGQEISLKQSGSNTSDDASLTGVVMKTVCQGAQPNYPERTPCTKSVATNTTISIFSGDQLISLSKTDKNGRYDFKVKTGLYTLRVLNESSSEGHSVEVKNGNNNLDINAKFDEP